jgi:hypothetical protein
VTTKMAVDRKKLFHLREYDAAFLKVFSRVTHLRAEEADPLLKEIPTEPRPAIHTSQVTLPSGEALTNEPVEMKVAFRFNLSDTVARMSPEPKRPAWNSFGIVRPRALVPDAAADV